MTGDEVIESTLVFVLRNADGSDDPWLRGYGIGQIDLAVWHLDADQERATAARGEIQRLTRRSEA